MEGLTITPDGSTLVGAMQAALQMPDLGSTKGSKVAVTESSRSTWAHVPDEADPLPVDNPATTGCQQQITALSNTKPWSTN